VRPPAGRQPPPGDELPSVTARAAADACPADRDEIEGEDETEDTTGGENAATAEHAAPPDALAEADPDDADEVIEATTGAPLSSLPRRAPLTTAPSGPLVFHGTTISPSAAAARTDSSAASGTSDDDDFWLPIEEVHWDGTPLKKQPRSWFGWLRNPSPPTQRRPARPVGPPRHPAYGLTGLILFSLLATFFAWVSAEPLWLAFGHGDRGTARVVGCTGQGLTVRCRADFHAADRSFTVSDVRLIGVEAGSRFRGSQLPARMTGPDGQAAYAGSTGELHLCWVLGQLMVLLCGYGIGVATGAPRLPGRPSRTGAMLVSVMAPLLITTGFLAATY
jgi:hypothetical protein